MLKRIVILSVGLCSLFMISCGKRVHLSSPTDGQVFQLAPSNGQYAVPQQLVIQLDDPNAYDRVQITLVGQERLPVGMLTCAGGGNQAMYCNVVAPQNGNIQQGTQYSLLVKAVDGDYLDARIVYFQIGTPFQQQQQPQIPPR